MKLARLFLLAALVGGVAVIGCGDDEPVNGTGGTGGGTGGTGGGTGGGGGGGDDPCTGVNCDVSTADNKTICDAAVEACNESPDYTDTQCNEELAGLICAADLSGAGGNGGNGGGGGECPTADVVCAGGLCTAEASKTLCTTYYNDCVDSGGSCDDCKDVADFWCRGEPAG